MLIIYLERLNAFSKDHANARGSISTWISVTERAIWSNMMDVLKSFPRAKIISMDRARFQILHNTYRLIVKVNFEAGIVEVRFIGTHNEYDRVDAKTI